MHAVFLKRVRVFGNAVLYLGVGLGIPVKAGSGLRVGVRAVHADLLGMPGCV